MKKLKKETEKLKNRICKRVENFLKIGPIKVEVIDYGFKGESDAAYSDSNGVFINYDWIIREEKNIDIDQTNFRTMIYHEFRHQYQMTQINKQINGEVTEESEELISLWKENRDNYIPNTEENSNYYKQPVEIDAIAFSIFLCMLDKKAGVSNLSLNSNSIPDGIDDLIGIRLNEICSFYNVSFDFGK